MKDKNVKNTSCQGEGTSGRGRVTERSKENEYGSFLCFLYKNDTEFLTC
jgi:hypothetical protein